MLALPTRRPCIIRGSKPEPGQDARGAIAINYVMRPKTSQAVEAASIMKRQLRRVAGATLVLFGALLMWLAPESLSGVMLLATGVALEGIGLVLEHRAGRSSNDRHAVER